MKFDFVIVGAGPAGIICAERLASLKNKSILVIEKRNHIGGNLYDYHNQEGILIHQYGPHFFRTDKEFVWNYLSQFTDWHHYEHKVMASVKGMLVPFPINLDTYNQLNNSRLTQKEFEYELAKNHFTDNPKNCEEAIINQVGKYLYETFFLNYTLKQWGKHPRELHPDTVKRVPVRTDRENRYQLAKYQGLPIHGYSMMMKRMLDKKNVKLMLNTDYKEMLPHLSFGQMIYTGPLDYYFDFELGELDYRSLKFVEKTYLQSSFQDHAVINYPNNFDYTRITEYKKMTGQQSEKTTVHYEYPLKYSKNENDPYYPILDKKNEELKNNYLKKVSQLKDIHFVGRLAEYRYYAMDDVVEAALTLCAQKFHVN
jgi:UDP-galactopyranose mutase